jgi:DNA helicase IV
MKIKTQATIKFYWVTKRFLFKNKIENKCIKIHLCKDVNSEIFKDKLKLNVKKQISVYFLSTINTREIKSFQMNDLINREDTISIGGFYLPITIAGEKIFNKNDNMNDIINTEFKKIKLELESEGWIVYGNKVIDF